MSAPDRLTSGSAVLPRPEVAAPPSWRFPEPTRFESSQGLQVQTFHLPGQHVLSVRVGVPAPLSAEPAALEGVGLIMARCLDEGTTRHTAEELAELLERRGIALGSGVGERGLVVDLDVAQRHLAPAMELLGECLSQASFPDREVHRHVRHRLADIGHEHADPGSRAALEFVATYFDPADRASRPGGGTPETVGAVTPQDVRTYYQDVVHPDGATLVLAGDLSDMDVPGTVERTLAGWQRGPQRPVPVPDPGIRAADAGRVVFVDRPGSVQTELYVGGPGPSRRDEFGWGTYQALSFVFGGSSHSRIDQVLREDKGYTYGFRGGFRPRSGSGLFVASGSVRAEVTAAGLEALLEVLATPGSELTDTELLDAASYVARTAPGRYATADAMAAEAVSLALDGLDTGFVSDCVEQARTLQPDHARAAWDSHRDSPWTVTLVGDAQEHAEAVGRLGLGPMTVLAAHPRGPDSG